MLLLIIITFCSALFSPWIHKKKQSVHTPIQIASLPCHAKPNRALRRITTPDKTVLFVSRVNKKISIFSFQSQVFHLGGVWQWPKCTWTIGTTAVGTLHRSKLEKSDSLEICLFFSIFERGGTLQSQSWFYQSFTYALITTYILFIICLCFAQHNSTYSLATYSCWQRVMGSTSAHKR